MNYTIDWQPIASMCVQTKLTPQVKEGIVFQRAAEDYSPPLKRLTIQTHLSRRRWATIHNLHVAPVKGPISSDSLALTNISVGSMITGPKENWSSVKNAL